MNSKFTPSFKIQAVEKALSRFNTVTVKDIATDLGVGYSTLNRWIVCSKKQQLEPIETNNVIQMIKEKRPQDWSAKDKLNMIISCAPLSDEQVSERCRVKGIFAHHIQQWKQDFLDGQLSNAAVTIRSSNKALRQENKALQKELNRKDKALAETAALLVLQKKVSQIWGNGEGNSL